MVRFSFPRYKIKNLSDLRLNLQKMANHISIKYLYLATCVLQLGCNL